MPGNQGDHSSRSRLDHALKTRTTLSSEFSTDLRGRNLALISGTKKEVRTSFLKQKLALKDMEARRIRLVAENHFKFGKIKRYLSDEDIYTLELTTEDLSKTTGRTPKSSDLVLLERQLEKQRQLCGFGKSSFRTVNVYKMDKKGDVVRVFDEMPVECMFPVLADHDADKTSWNSPPEPSNSRNADDDEADDASGSKEAEAEPGAEKSVDDYPTPEQSRQRARGEDKPELLAVHVPVSRSMSELTGRMKEFMGQLKLDDNMF